MLQFDAATHTYSVNGKRMTSVTQFKSKLFPKFDSDLIIERMMASPNWASSVYYPKTKDEILQSWNDASRLGTQMHASIESYLNGLPVDDATPEFEQFKQFAATMGPVYHAEWQVFDEEYGIAGTIDAVFKRDDGTVDIYDWKRTKGLSKYSSSRALHPEIAHLPDSNYWQYSIQLNLYRAILERKGYTVAGMYLVCCHPTLSEYVKEECPVLPVEKILGQQE